MFSKYRSEGEQKKCATDAPTNSPSHLRFLQIFLPVATIFLPVAPFPRPKGTRRVENKVVWFLALLLIDADHLGFGAALTSPM
jgi:hypothetical protein